MLKFSQIRQYTQTSNGIRWDRKINESPFMLFYFSENSNFLEDFPKLNLLPRDVRVAVYPNMRLPRIRLTSPIAKMYRNSKLLIYSTDLNIPENKNIILDFTPYLRAIDLNYNPMDYRKRAGMLIQNAMRDIFGRFSNYRKVLLYSTDITKEIPDFINKKLFLTIKQMRMPDAMIPFDDMFIININELTASYRLVVKNREYKFNRIFFYFRNVLQKEMEEETNEELENISQHIISKIEDKITVQKTQNKKQKDVDEEKNKIEEKKKNISTAIKLYLKQSPKKTELVNSGKADETILKRMAIASILYKMSGDLQRSNKIARQITKDKIDNAVKVLDKNYVDELLPRKKIEILTKEIVLKDQDITNKLDNKYPNHLFEKRKLDFEINLNKDMTNAFKVLETKDIPLKLENLAIEPIQRKIGELDPTDKSILKATMKDQFGNLHNINMELPQIGEDGTFRIYGKRKCLINQIVLCPISFLKPYMAKFESSYAIFTVWSKRLRTGNRLRIFIGSLKMPLLLILAYKYGFDNILKDYDINYRITEEKPNKNEIYSMKLQNDSYIIFENVDTELKIELCNSFIKEKIGSFSTKQEFGTKNYFAEIILRMTGRSHSTYLIDNTLDNIVDPIAKQILLNQGLPTDLDKIIKYMAERVVQGYLQDRNDLSNQRIRNSEVLVHLAQKQILAAYTVYREQVLAGNKEAILKITPTNVLKDFIKTEIAMEMEFSNPLEEMSFITRISPVGKQIGGIPSKTAFQLDARSVNTTYFGNIDPLDTPEGPNIGIVQQLAVDANITTIRGLFKSKNITNKEKSGILSTSTCMTPFIECNEGVRTIMAANQSRQMLPLKNPEAPIVQTGYETVLSGLLSKNFVKKSPVDGKIISIEKDHIIILGKDGKKYDVDITLRELRSGSGKNTLSIFNPVVNVGQNVKKDQFLAEGACLKNGVISMGRNLLCAILPYQGYNFEDGIIINKRLFDENKLTSLHLIVEEVQLLEGDRITFINKNIGSYTDKGEHLLRKTIGELDRLLGVEESEEENDEYVAGQFIKKSPGGKIVDIEVFSNVDMENYPQIKDLIIRTDKLQNRLKGEKYRINEKPIDGILIRYKIQQELSIMSGDKLCNRHGNKGIISRVEEDERMPRTPWGETVDIVFNPLGIINRMNIGQLYEMYCGLIGKNMANLIIKNKNKKYTIDILTKVLPLLSGDENLPETKKLINSITKLTDKDFKIFLEQLNENGFFPIVVTPFKSPKYKNIKKALDILGLETGYKIYIPDYGYSEQRVPIGYMYIAKLEHMGDVKIHARSTGPVVRKLGQPTEGKRREGGQRLGEMDTWSLTSYNALKVMQELMGPLSDDQVSKNEMISEIITTGKTEFKNTKINPTKDLLNAYFISLMLEGK